MSAVPIQEILPAVLARIDVDQVAFDLDEAHAQLRRIGQAAELVDQLRGKVERIKRDLNHAKDELQQAEWNVVAIAKSIHDREQRRAKRWAGSPPDCNAGRAWWSAKIVPAAGPRSVNRARTTRAGAGLRTLCLWPPRRR